MTGGVGVEDLGDARRMARPALRQAVSREALGAAARREARMSLGKRHFVLRERVLPVGLPLASLAAIVAYHTGGRGRRRRARERRLLAALGAAGAMVALSYGAAVAEWELFERTYRRENDLDV